MTRRPLLLGLAALAALLAGRPAAAQAADEAVVPVAARDLDRGEVLTRADVAFAPAGDRRTSGVVERPVGWVTRRVVAAGEVLRAPTIARPDAVRSGDPVLLVWRDGGVELRIRGKAMGSAALGERITVHVDGRRRFEGVVESPTLVRLQAPEKERR